MSAYKKRAKDFPHRKQTITIHKLEDGVIVKFIDEPSGKGHHHKMVIVREETHPIVITKDIFHRL